MGDDSLAQRPREGDRAYIARLEAIDRSRLDEDGQLAFTLCLSLARKRLRRQWPATEREFLPDHAEALERCKQAVRGLKPDDRKRLVLWINGGMRD